MSSRPRWCRRDILHLLRHDVLNGDAWLQGLMMIILAWAILLKDPPLFPRLPSSSSSSSFLVFCLLLHLLFSFFRGLTRLRHGYNLKLQIRHYSFYRYIDFISRWKLDFTAGSTRFLLSYHFSLVLLLSVDVSRPSRAVHYASSLPPFALSEPAQPTFTKWNSFVCLQMLIEHIMNATQKLSPLPDISV